MELTLGEICQAAFVGIMRQTNAMKGDWPDRYGPPKSAWGVHIEGCIAEMVVAKSLGVFWDGYSRSPKKLPGDVGQWQVRSTPLDKGCLIVHDEDSDAAAFVLVVGSGTKYRIAGWIRGADAKQKRFWKNGDGRPAYFVPQRELIPWENRGNPIEEHLEVKDGKDR